MEGHGRAATTAVAPRADRHRAPPARMYLLTGPELPPPAGSDAPPPPAAPSRAPAPTGRGAEPAPGARMEAGVRLRGAVAAAAAAVLVVVAVVFALDEARSSTPGGRAPVPSVPADHRSSPGVPSVPAR